MTMTQETTEQRPSALVWVNERHAIVAHSRGRQRLSMSTVDRAGAPALEYLARIVHEVGPGEEVIIVGADPIRVALEREYVAISHRPDHLLARPDGLRSSSSEMVDRLRRLAAA